MKLSVKHKEKSPLECKLKLLLRQKLSYFLSSFFLLACFVYAFFVIAQGTSNVLVEDACDEIISPLYRSSHWKALALSLERDLFAYLSTFLIATSFFCVGGNGAFNSTTHTYTTTIWLLLVFLSHCLRSCCRHFLQLLINYPVHVQDNSAVSHRLQQGRSSGELSTPSTILFYLMSVWSPSEAMQTNTNLGKSLNRKTLGAPYWVHTVNPA